MKIETSKKTICIKRIVKQEIKQIELNEDVIIPDVKPDILKPIKESGNICIYKKEVLDGKIKLEGSVNVYLIYLADSEKYNLRGINTNIDFKEIFEYKEAKESMCLEEKLNIKSIECKVLNGRKVSINIEIEAILTLFTNENINMIDNISNIKDIQRIDKTVKINSVIGNNSVKTYAKETVKIDVEDILAEILKVDISIINKDTKVSYNKLLAKADAELKIMYLTEDNRIRNVEEKIPIMGFIEMPNISEEDTCDVLYTIKNILIKPNAEEEHSIYVELELELTCNSFRGEEMSIIEDLYSPSTDLKYNLNNVKTVVKKDCKRGNFEIKEKIQIPELSGEKIYNINVMPILNNTKISNDKIVLEGDLKMDFIISSNNSTTTELITKSIPFINTMEYEGIVDQNKIDVDINVTRQDFGIEDIDITVNVNLFFEVCRYDELDLNIIEDVIENEESCDGCKYSMTIYFVKPGDSLWKIAKKFRSTIEDIVKLNNIENPEKIDVGMQLFIPKYVCVKENG